MKNYITVDGKKSINLPEEYKDMHDVVRGTISWQVWEKGNKKRVYGKVYCGGKVIEVGYVDLVSGQWYYLAILALLLNHSPTISKS